MFQLFASFTVNMLCMLLWICMLEML